MTNLVEVDIQKLEGWQLRYALATHVGSLETKITPSLRFTNGEPFSIMEMVDRPAYRDDGSEVEGSRVKRKEPRALRSEELRGILDKYDLQVSDEGLDYACTVDGCTFKGIFEDEVKARAIVAFVTRLKKVLVPDYQ